MKKLLLATVTLTALAIVPAQAVSLIAAAVVDGSLVSTQSSADGNLNINSQSFGPIFNLNSVTINAGPDFLANLDILRTNTLDVNSFATGNHQLVLDITAFGLVGTNSIQSLLSSFSVTGMTDGWTAREQTFINNVLLSDTGVFTQTADSAFSINPALLTGSYNAEVKYTINSVGTGNFNGGIDIAVTVPGPVAGAGLPGILAAMVGLWGLAKRRRRRLGLSV